ncbi:hypothetical protein [Actinoplanes sp. M2I2]|uniref:hypothetical protein n=1 Tax=Actinoplanes sp. M2I2 TaxID=1734444 RepID=UPI00202156B6|nr:hypothetical protein [Actinoplanes sp. M2I2]
MSKGVISAILAGFYLTIALCCLSVVVVSWALERPLGLIADLPSWVPIGLFAALAPAIVVAVAEQFRERFGEAGTAPKVGGWWAGLSAVALGLTAVGILTGVMSLDSAGAPSPPRADCAHPLREKGNIYTCVSAADYREAGAGAQRQVAGLGLAFSAASAAAFLAITRRQRAV